MNRVLIIKLAAIGDVAMALPMISEIRGRHPDAHIAWMCGKTVAPLLELTRDIDEYIVVDEEKLFKGSPLDRLIELGRIWLLLFRRHFDLVCVAHIDWRYHLLAATVRAHQKRFLKKPRNTSRIFGRHHSHMYLDMVTDGKKASTPLPTCPTLKAVHSTRLDTLLKDVTAPMAVLVPGGASNILHTDTVRRWPLENYAILAEALLAKGMAVAIVGASSDSYVSASFSDKRIIDLVGKTNLQEYLEVLRRARIVISHDTSAAHLTYLTNTPIVALFGPTSQHERLLPRSSAVGIWGGAELPCRPCYDGRTFYPCRTVNCMREISPSIVLDSAVALLRTLPPT